ncbi:MAG: undecaprenyl/decaprenyl-phosphate alpha-N-acetylglucosaminyl 1-phosphate transferase [Halioglobus sp.]|nr:undecaprenyl/decaprenyl-phosphate alpha-N-acetylglucosaminyl 1-phosphate transferase [Halioglobus sp.]
MLTLKILIAAYILLRISAFLGMRVGLLDSPDTRKRHAGDVPVTGGIGIFLTLMFGTFVLGIAPYTYPMLLIACALFVISVYDDVRQISASARLLLQYVSGLLLALFGGIVILNVGNLLALGNIPLLMLSVPLTALAVAGLTNAYNMVDGIDGLAASTLGLPLLVLYLLAMQAGHPMASALLLILLPVMVFLLFNLGVGNVLLPKMFLGDAGSVVLGFLVTASLIYFSQQEEPLIQPVTALWLVTLPLMDMLATMLRRHRYGRSLIAADRSHLHHTLIDRGMGSRWTLLLLVVYAAVCAVLGLLLELIPAYGSLFCYLLLFCGHCSFVLRAGAPKG